MKRRNYFRCTHKFDQGCQASKQVQQIHEDPPLFKTTYHGHHTCKNLFKSPHQIIIDAATQDSSIIWSFQSREPTAAAYKPDGGLKIGSTEVKSEIKQENKEEDYQMKSSPPCRDYYISPELTFDTSTDHLAAFSSGSDHGGDVISSDVYSCTASTHSMDMDLVGSVNFEDFLEFGSLS